VRHGCLEVLVDRQPASIIGSETGSPWFYTSPMYFPQASSGDLLIEAGLGAAGDIGRGAGRSKLGVLSCIEAEVCRRTQDIARNRASAFGMTVVYNGQASITQPDYTSNCQAAAQAGTEILFIAMDGNSIQRVARSCNSVNFHPLFATVSSAASFQLAADPLVNGMAVGMVVMPWTVTTNPAVVEFHNTLRQYAPGLQPGPATMSGWVAAKLLEVAAQRLSDPPTSQNILDGLWAVQNLDLGGLTQPLTFIRDHNAVPRLCYWQLQVRDGNFESPNGGRRNCV